jgi:hypothetical protein
VRAALVPVALAAALGVGGTAQAFPTSSVTSPQRWAAYAQDEVVLAEYSCADPEYGVAACFGSVPTGTPVDTSTPGRHLLTVTSLNTIGWSSTGPVYYWVVGFPFSAGEAVPRGEGLTGAVRCAADPPLPGDPSCTVSVVGPGGGAPQEVAAGEALPTGALGTYTVTVTVTDGDSTATIARSYEVVDRTAPQAVIDAPGADAVIEQGAASPAGFRCSDEAGGSGLATGDGCTATVTAPGGAAVPLRQGDAVPSERLGQHEIEVTARDAAGNVATARRSYAVVARQPVAGGDVVPPPAARRCPVRAIELLAIHPDGTRSRPTARLSGWADATLVGATVTVRRDGRAVGRATVGRDGTVRAVVPAPRGVRARAQARYRLVVGSLRSRALKATRQVRYAGVVRKADGTVVVSGRSANLRSRRLTVVGRSTCGVGPSSTRTIRADRRGRFRVVLQPPAPGRAVIYRLRAGSWSATLPVVVTGR